MQSNNNKIKLFADISSEMKESLIDIIKNQLSFSNFTSFTMQYAEHFYNSQFYHQLIPDPYSLSYIYNNFGPGSNKTIHVNHLVFYFPKYVVPYFDFMRQVYCRPRKNESTFFIYCLYTNLYFHRNIYLT